MAQHSEHKRLPFGKGWVFNRGIEPNTEHGETDSNKETKGTRPNTTRHTWKRLKAKIETDKSKDTTHGHVYTRRVLESRRASSSGCYSPPFLICDTHIARPSGLVFLSKPSSRFSLCLHLSILYSLIFHPSPG